MSQKEKIKNFEKKFPDLKCFKCGKEWRSRKKTLLEVIHCPNCRVVSWYKKGEELK